MPEVKCRFCRSKKFVKSYVRKNKHSWVQVYLCRTVECGRRFTPDDGFLHMTYRGNYVVPALEDRGSGKAPHDTRDSLSKNGGRPDRTTLFRWNVKFSRMVTPLLMSLDYQLSETAYVDEMVFRIGGISHVAYSIEDWRTRL